MGAPPQRQKCLYVRNLSIKVRHRAKLLKAHKVRLIILLMQATTLQKFNSSCQNAYYCYNFTVAQYVHTEPPQNSLLRWFILNDQNTIVNLNEQ